MVWLRRLTPDSSPSQTMSRAHPLSSNKETGALPTNVTAAAIDAENTAWLRHERIVPRSRLFAHRVHKASKTILEFIVEGRHEDLEPRLRTFATLFVAEMVRCSPSVV